MLKIAYSSPITLAAMLKTRSARRLARCLLPAFLCAHISTKRETSGYEAVTGILIHHNKLLFDQIWKNFAIIEMMTSGVQESCRLLNH